MTATSAFDTRQTSPTLRTAYSSSGFESKSGSESKQVAEDFKEEKIRVITERVKTQVPLKKPEAAYLLPLIIAALNADSIKHYSPEVQKNLQRIAKIAASSLLIVPPILPLQAKTLDKINRMGPEAEQVFNKLKVLGEKIPKVEVKEKNTLTSDLRILNSTLTDLVKEKSKLEEEIKTDLENLQERITYLETYSLDSSPSEAAAKALAPVWEPPVTLKFFADQQSDKVRCKQELKNLQAALAFLDLNLNAAKLVSNMIGGLFNLEDMLPIINKEIAQVGDPRTHHNIFWLRTVELAEREAIYEKMNTTLHELMGKHKDGKIWFNSPAIDDSILQRCSEHNIDPTGLTAIISLHKALCEWFEPKWNASCLDLFKLKNELDLCKIRLSIDKLEKTHDTNLKLKDRLSRVRKTESEEAKHKAAYTEVFAKYDFSNTFFENLLKEIEELSSLTSEALRDMLGCITFTHGFKTEQAKHVKALSQQKCQLENYHSKVYLPLKIELEVELSLMLGALKYAEQNPRYYDGKFNKAYSFKITAKFGLTPKPVNLNPDGSTSPEEKSLQTVKGAATAQRSQIGAGAGSGTVHVQVETGAGAGAQLASTEDSKALVATEKKS